MFASRQNLVAAVRGRRGGYTASGAWTVSVLVHGLLFVLLACFVLPSVDITGLLKLEGQRGGPIAPLTFVTPLPIAFQPEATPSPADPLLPVELAAAADIEPLRTILDEMALEDVPPIDLFTDSPLSSKPVSHIRGGREVQWDMREASTPDAITSVPGVEAAIGKIEEAIRGELEQGDTLVVWLMDASISLQLNRQLMASRLAQFHQSIGLATRKDGLESRSNPHRLFSCVVAFGNSAKEVQGPTLTGLKAVHEIASLPTDPSGIEMTMSAVNHVVNFYRDREHRRERMIIVLLTDESGDDGLKIEETIFNCRRAGVPVHVIGPTAVMGLQEGSQLWTASVGGQVFPFLLKVNRGPETCLPERAFLPYWHERPLSSWRPNVRPANAVPWHGGEYREGVLSGFGPYTLTRLALQTGGSYLLYDGGGTDRYDLAKLREYLPEYGSLADYHASIDGRPLRKFVVEAAAITMQESENLAPLRMMFFGSRSPQYPFAPISVYMNPSSFRRQFEAAVRLEMRRAKRAAERVDLLMSAYQENGLEYEYAKEDSARWRASFDLSWGRLLAASVRYDEYIATCELLLQTKFGALVNEVMLVPGNQFRVSSSASTAQRASKFLERCQLEHRSTPWSDLAAWELQTGFGIQVQTKEIPPPPPPSATMGFPSSSMGLKSHSGGGGSFSFPSL